MSLICPDGSLNRIVNGHAFAFLDYPNIQCFVGKTVAGKWRVYEHTTGLTMGADTTTTRAKAVAKQWDAFEVLRQSKGSIEAVEALVAECVRKVTVHREAIKANTLLTQLVPSGIVFS